MTGEKVKGRFTDIPANIRATIEDMKNTSISGALVRHGDRFGISNRKLIH